MQSRTSVDYTGKRLKTSGNAEIADLVGYVFEGGDGHETKRD
jgi:hypothetical protein